MSSEDPISQADLDKFAPRVSEILLNLASTRGAEKTFCPSEAARQLDAADWRRYMPLVRAIGIALWREEKLQVFQKGLAVDPTLAKGPIRYGLPR